MTGRRKHFYSYDVVSGTASRVPFIRGRLEKSLEWFTASPDGKYLAFVGDNGEIVLVSARSKQWVANLKMNGMVVIMC